MKKCVNGIFIEMTEEEVLEVQAAHKEALFIERTRPRTIEEGLIELNRTIVTEKIADSEDKTLGIACMALFKSWTNDVYEIGDIRTNPTTGYPYECILAHDSSVNTDWTIDVRTLWKPYHSRKKEYALPWEAPTGAHDMYKSGEYMIWTDGEIYYCKSNTNFNPDDYADAWEIVE
jgi:hypothetical protein